METPHTGHKCKISAGRVRNTNSGICFCPVRRSHCQDLRFILSTYLYIFLPTNLFVSISRLHVNVIWYHILPCASVHSKTLDRLSTPSGIHGTPVEKRTLASPWGKPTFSTAGVVSVMSYSPPYMNILRTFTAIKVWHFGVTCFSALSWLYLWAFTLRNA